MEEILQPIYRIEDYWYAIVNGLSCPHTPIYRIEQYLAYLCGADVSVPQPIYRIEQYLAYKCGLDVELPEPIYRQEMFLAKWCGMDVEPPTPIYRIEVLLSQLSNGELKTVTGNPISVSDALAKPAESLTIEILPYQSGSGDPSPDNVRPITGFTGVNIYHESAYDPDADPTYAIDWTDEAGTVYGGTLDVTTGVVTVTHKYYTYNGSENWDIAGSRVYLYLFGAESSKSNDDTSQISNLFVGGGLSYADYGKFRVQTNGAVCVGNKISEGVYNWNTRDEFKTFLSSNNLQICYELATPLTIQLTPTQVDMLLDNNVLWNDVDGDMTLEYLADGPADDVDALNILLGNRYVNNGEPDEATDSEALDILLGGNTR